MDICRRDIISLVGTTVMTSMAGCSSEQSGEIRPNQSPKAVESFTCENDDLERHPRMYDATEWGDTDQFSLRVESTSYKYGDNINIWLTNTSSGPKVIGNRYSYNLEIFTNDSWNEIRWGDGSFGYSDEAIQKEKDEGFQWNIEFTESGIADATNVELSVCPDLVSGRYRFVYWGLSGTAVAVSFDLRK